MYEYFEGIVKAIYPDYLVLDVGQIGYKIFSPNPYSYDLNGTYTIYIEQIIRENAHTLYGFASLEQKSLFLSLLTVSGIGPKSALAIMASENTQSLANAIENGEVQYLTKFPGVGKKTASQIVLDLKGKLGQFTQETTVDAALKDALLALVALGYTQKEVDRISKTLAENPEQTTDEYIKQGLRLLLKK